MTSESESSIYAGLSPSFFGLPEKFKEFRPAQIAAMEYAVYECKKKFTALALPTGSGKSLLGVAIAKALGLKAVYLTATRALEDQVGAEFLSAGLVDVRGRANYKCAQMYPGRKYESTCEYGHQHECSLERTPSCGYNAAVAAAQEADLVVTNYSYWMHARKYNQNALASIERPIELMIADEFGDVPEIVSDFVSITVNHDDEELPIQAPRRGQDLPSGLMPEPVWTTWAVERLSEALKQMARIAENYGTKAAAMKDDRYVYLVELMQTCGRIPTLGTNWVWEVNDCGVKFQPIWPGQMASALWSGVPRILPMSATLRPYTLGLMDVKPEQYDYREWPAVFLPQYGPVYHLPAVKLTWKSTDEDYREMARVADECLDQRDDRRTLVQTNSYRLAKRYGELTRHRARMIFNESGRDAAACADQFRNGPENGVLVGPSYSTGIDFPGRQCEFQLILKTPYPDTTSRVMTERCRNSDYRMHVTVQKLVQMVGRPRRSATDRAETVILDNGIKWAMGGPRNPWHGHAPGYFRVQTISKLPPRPMRVNL